MPITFSIYLTQLVNALQNENGSDLALLLRPTSPHGKDLIKELRNPSVRALLAIHAIAAIIFASL